MNKLQKVQNKADRISPHLASLLWLTTDSRIQYKVASLCYNYNCLCLTASGE